ncbi:MAG TPA: hypothetical protein VMW10_05940, partial [Alphaproteobacteria bacterium]|nr:hypothetical protein [Alphaproteobacteria bacterium]
CGVHQAAFKDSYEDSGTFYSPTLLLLQARSIKYIQGHKSYLKDGLITATSELVAGQGVKFKLRHGGENCFLQLSSQRSLDYNGEIRQHSSRFTHFPLMDYFPILNPKDEKPLSFDHDFAKKMATLPLGPWSDVKKSLGSGITLKAGRALSC